MSIPGTMSPFQHGEVFVTDDGAETDLDLGHYERYGNVTTGQKNNFTSGRIYFNVISKERRGDYLGGTVQVVPHITDEIKRAITDLADDEDVVIVEIGGTIGDIESLPFLEAIRQLRYSLGRQNVLYVHLTLVPFIKAADELKTKPTQHSVKELQSIGIQPNILVCRSERPIPKEMKRKIALFCNVDENAVITAQDVETIYEVPLQLAGGGDRRPDRGTAGPERREQKDLQRMGDHRQAGQASRSRTSPSRWSENISISKRRTRAFARH